MSDRTIAVRGRPTDWKYVVAATLSPMLQTMQLPMRIANAPASVTPGASAMHHASERARRSCTAHEEAMTTVVSATERSMHRRTRAYAFAPQL